tara:strand:- start:739 stop:963 length:225 start_codon:yes stop_codon:yes gene_type:complete
MTDKEKIQALREGTPPDKIFTSMFDFADLMIKLAKENDALSEQLETQKKLTKQKVELLKLDISNAFYEIKKNHG